jgi:hypothetical protein
MAVTTRGVPPPNQPSLVRATMVSTTSTSGNGLLPSLAEIIAPLSQSATGPPFTYKMPGFDPNVVLFHSTQPTLSLGVGSSNTPLQGSTGGIPAPYNAFPYGGGHIPPSFPILSGTHQQSVGPSTNYGSYGVSSQGLPSNSQLVGSTPFSLFGAFANNAFSSTAFPTRGNPDYGQLNPMQGTIPTEGENPGILSPQGPWNPWQGSTSSSWMSTGGNPFQSHWNPKQGSTPMPVGSAGGIPSQNPWTAMQAQPPSSFYGI